MHKGGIVKTISVVSILVALGGAAAPTPTIGAETTMFEEVIVTALKREESALNGQTLDDIVIDAWQMSSASCLAAS